MEIKIALDKVTDKAYMFGVFDDLNGMFKEFGKLWGKAKDSDKIGEWIDDLLKDEHKIKAEDRDEFITSIKTLLDNHGQFADIYTDWEAKNLADHNAEVIKIMINAVGTDAFKTILDNAFNVTAEPVSKVLNDYKEKAKPAMWESLNSNLITMAGDFAYYKEIADTVLGSMEAVADNSEPTDATEVTPTEDNNTVATPVEGDTTPVEDQGEPAEPAIEDGLIFSTEISTVPFDVASVKTACSTIITKETLGEEDCKKMVDEVFAIARSAKASKCWKLAHHEVSIEGDKITVAVNESALKSATASLLSGKNTFIATTDEKQAAAAHLVKHYTDLGLEIPENLSKVAENSKFADLVVESDLVLALDDAFVQKIIEEETKIENESIDPESEVLKVLDAIYIVMRPFVKDGAKVDINEDTYKKLQQSINGSAIGIASILNGEGSDIMNLSDNAIVSTMRTQINTLKDELTSTKDQMVLVTNERDSLLTKVSDYETKVETIGQLSADVNNASKLVEEINSLNNQKLAFVFKHRAVIDEDIYKEVMTAKSVDKISEIGKWVNKLGNKKVVLNNAFTEKVIPESVEIETTQTVVDNGTFTLPSQNQEKKLTAFDIDEQVRTIINIVKNQ